MHIIPSFESAREAVLKQAILLYDSHSGGCIPQVHSILTRRGRPTLGPGVTPSDKELRRLIEQMQTGPTVEPSAKLTLLPDNVLIANDTSLVWWIPAQRRRIWFRSTNQQDRFDPVNGELVWHPPLVFAATSEGFFIVALPKNERPTLQTKVRRAPYWNCHEDTAICMGSAPVPDRRVPSLIPAFEKAFFDSNFSHTVQGVKTMNSRLSYAAFWEQRKRSRFPAAALATLTNRSLRGRSRAQTTLQSWLEYTNE